MKLQIPTTITSNDAICATVWFTSVDLPPRAYFYFKNIFDFTHFLNLYNSGLSSTLIVIKKVDLYPLAYLNPYELLY